jgi:hypothetical protein
LRQAILIQEALFEDEGSYSQAASIHSNVAGEEKVSRVETFCPGFAKLCEVLPSQKALHFSAKSCGHYPGIHQRLSHSQNVPKDKIGDCLTSDPHEALSGTEILCSFESCCH